MTTSGPIPHSQFVEPRYFLQPGTAHTRRGERAAVGKSWWGSGASAEPMRGLCAGSLAIGPPIRLRPSASVQQSWLAFETPSVLACFSILPYSDCTHQVIK
jgi:hypothetical protein